MATTQTSQANPTQSATAGYVLPPPPRSRSPLLVESEAAAPALAALRAAGSRMQVLLACQRQFFAELRSALAEVDAAVHEEPRARIKREVGKLGEILDWCDKVHDDLLAESDRAALGHEPIDLETACRDAVDAIAADGGPTAQVQGQAATPWWGSRTGFDHALRLALELVSARIGGFGSLQVEISQDPTGASIRVFGLGEPRALPATAPVAEFRAAVGRLGIFVQPDQFGAGGSGMVLRLPHPHADED